MDRITIIGGGSWGTAFAHYLCGLGKEVRLWVREPEVMDSIRNHAENRLFLKDIPLCDNLEPVAELEKETEKAETLIFAVPSQYIRSIFERVGHRAQGKPVINLSKGFEADTSKTISQIAADVFGNSILERWVTLSGPSFARELAAGYPTAIVAASKNSRFAQEVQGDFSSSTLRLYTSDDLTGVEVGGSLKNIMAIASGMVKGSGYGYNTTASLITRASVEIARFGQRLGARKETFWGLAGIGDLMLTSFGSLSRNYQLGVRIAEGETLQSIQSSTAMVAEGVETTKAIKQLADREKIDMPITREVYHILFERKDPREALRDLMERSLKSEWPINSNM